MAKVIVGMTTSLDGFVNDRNGSVARLYPDLAALRKTEMLQDAIANTGAVVMGRRAYEMANGDFTGYEFQVPIFVLTHHPPEAVAKGENAKLSFTFVGDLISAIQRARKAAGDKKCVTRGRRREHRSAVHQLGAGRRNRDRHRPRPFRKRPSTLREPWRRAGTVGNDPGPQVGGPDRHHVPGGALTGSASPRAARARSIRATIRRVSASIAA